VFATSAVEDELAALKKGMIKGPGVPVGALPEGRPIKDALDLELEELRRKARE
jgi:phage shock protein A